MIKRILIVLIAATVVLVGAYSVYVLMTDNGMKSSNSNNANTVADATNAATNTTTNGSIVNRPAPKLKGDVTVNKAVTYREVLFDVDTAYLDSSFRDSSAPKDSSFLVLFLKPYLEAPKSDPTEWAGQEISLTAGSSKNIRPSEVAIPKTAGQSGGYLVFTVPSGQTDYALTFGSGTTAQTLSFTM